MILTLDYSLYLLLTYLIYHEKILVTEKRNGSHKEKGENFRLLTIEIAA